MKSRERTGSILLPGYYQKQSGLDFLNRVAEAAKESLHVFHNLDEIPDIVDSALVANLQIIYDTGLLAVEGDGDSDKEPKTDFNSNPVYVRAAPHVIAMCPSQHWDIYTPEWQEAYRTNAETPNGGLRAPHCFGVVEGAYRNLANNSRQSIVVMGEAGSGKTFNCFQMQEYIVDQFPCSKDLREKTLAGHHVLRAFCAAQTSTSKYASKCCTFTSSRFAGTDTFSLVGVEIECLLFDASRALNAPSDESTFAIIGAVAGMTGIKGDMLKRLNISPSADARGNMKSDCPHSDQMPDVGNVNVVRNLLSKFNLTTSEIDQVFDILCGLVHLGSLQFEIDSDDFCENSCDESYPAPAPIAQLATVTHLLEAHLLEAASKLGVKAEALRRAILRLERSSSDKYSDTASVKFSKSLFDGPWGKAVTEPAPKLEVTIKLIYESLVKFIVDSVNKCLSDANGSSSEADASCLSDATGSSSEADASICICDIPGFSNGNVVGFEQLLVNFAYEKMQQFYLSSTRSMLSSMHSDGPRPELNLQDNCTVVRLAKHVEVLYRGGVAKPDFDEMTQVQFPNIFMGSDRIRPIISRITSQSERTGHNETVASSETCFLIKHHIRDVIYDSRQFSTRLVDSLWPSVFACLSDTENTLLKKCLEKTRTHKGSKTQNVLERVPGEFRVLMETNLEESQCQFVRCVNPADANGAFSPLKAMQQLEDCGIMPVLSACRANLSARFPHIKFLREFKILDDGEGPVVDGDSDAIPNPKEQTENILNKYLVNEFPWEVGPTHVFLDASGLDRLQTYVNIFKKRCAITIRGHFRSKFGLDMFLRVLDYEKQMEQIGAQNREYGVEAAPDIMAAMEDAAESFSVAIAEETRWHQAKAAWFAAEGDIGSMPTELLADCGVLLDAVEEADYFDFVAETEAICAPFWACVIENREKAVARAAALVHKPLASISILIAQVELQQNMECESSKARNEIAEMCDATLQRLSDEIARINELHQEALDEIKKVSDYTEREPHYTSSLDTVLSEMISEVESEARDETASCLQRVQATASATATLEKEFCDDLETDDEYAELSNRFDAAVAKLRAITVPVGLDAECDEEVRDKLDSAWKMYQDVLDQRNKATNSAMFKTLIEWFVESEVEATKAAAAAHSKSVGRGCCQGFERLPELCELHRILTDQLSCLATLAANLPNSESEASDAAYKAAQAEYTAKVEDALHAVSEIPLDVPTKRKGVRFVHDGPWTPEKFQSLTAPEAARLKGSCPIFAKNDARDIESAASGLNSGRLKADVGFCIVWSPGLERHCLLYLQEHYNQAAVTFAVDTGSALARKRWKFAIGSALKYPALAQVNNYIDWKESRARAEVERSLEHEHSITVQQELEIVTAEVEVETSAEVNKYDTKRGEVLWRIAAEEPYCEHELGMLREQLEFMLAMAPMVQDDVDIGADNGQYRPAPQLRKRLAIASKQMEQMPVILLHFKEAIASQIYVVNERLTFQGNASASSRSSVVLSVSAQLEGFCAVLGKWGVFAEMAALIPKIRAFAAFSGQDSPSRKENKKLLDELKSIDDELWPAYDRMESAMCFVEQAREMVEWDNLDPLDLPSEPDIDSGVRNMTVYRSPSAKEAWRKEIGITDPSGKATVVAKKFCLAIGDRVVDLATRQKRGVIRYLGPTSFCTGTWAGVELDKPVGTNSGCVNAELYFPCKQGHGMFFRPRALDKIYKNSSNDKKTKRRTFRIGDRVVDITTRRGYGTVKYIGSPLFATGIWIGVELDVPEGDNDGAASGQRLFSCRPLHGMLFRARVLELVSPAKKNRKQNRGSEVRGAGDLDSTSFSCSDADYLSGTEAASSVNDGAKEVRGL